MSDGEKPPLILFSHLIANYTGSSLNKNENDFSVRKQSVVYFIFCKQRLARK